MPRMPGGGEGVKDPPPLQHNRALSAPEGGRPPQRSKAQTCKASFLRGRTFRYERYMETSCITTMIGRTWQGEYRTTPLCKVVGGG